MGPDGGAPAAPAHGRPFQVSGHPDSLTLLGQGDEWIVKQCHESEALFYQSVWFSEERGPPPEMRSALRELMPDCAGVADPQGVLLPGWPPVARGGKLPNDGQHAKLVLENLCRPFRRANISDIKLGTMLYNPHNPKLTADKRRRMQVKAATTTSGSFGLRFTGWQTWDAAGGTYRRVGKEPGRRAADLDDLYELWATVLQWDDAALRPARRRVLQEYIMPQLETLVHVLQTLDVRLPGASILLIVEADPPTLEAHLAACTSPVSMRLIDFAHSRWCPGEGPDLGFLQGLDTLQQLCARTLASDA